MGAARFGRGDLRFRLPLSQNDEFGLLTKELNQMAERLELAINERIQYADRLHRALNRQIQIQEVERKRISKEIHDGVTQWLMGALFEIQAVRVRLPNNDDELHHHIAEAQNVIKQAKEEMHRVIHNLHPVILTMQGLVPAIRDLIANLQARKILDVILEIKGEHKRLPERYELAIYRIIQEALNNVVQHAGTKRAWIAVEFDSEMVTLKVIDRGCGFNVILEQNKQSNPSNIADNSAGNWGLLNMQERAKSIDAELTIASQSDKGTELTLVVPVAVLRNEH